jgi:hypothetical protein
MPQYLAYPAPNTAHDSFQFLQVVNSNKRVYCNRDSILHGELPFPIPLGMLVRLETVEGKPDVRAVNIRFEMVCPGSPAAGAFFMRAAFVQRASDRPRSTRQHNSLSSTILRAETRREIAGCRTRCILDSGLLRKPKKRRKNAGFSTAVA